VVKVRARIIPCVQRPDGCNLVVLLKEILSTKKRKRKKKHPFPKTESSACSGTNTCDPTNKDRRKL